MGEYSKEELCAIYELGRLYYEMGYFAPAERIFNGLATIDRGLTAARVALGLIKLELGSHRDSSLHFRNALESGTFEIEAKMGLCAAFLATGEIPRARSILGQIETELKARPDIDPEVIRLWEAFQLRAK